MKVEFDSVRSVVVLDGVPIALSVLKHLVDPPHRHFMQLERRGDVVEIHTFDPRCAELQEAIQASVAALDKEAAEKESRT